MSITNFVKWIESIGFRSKAINRKAYQCLSKKNKRDPGPIK